MRTPANSTLWSTKTICGQTIPERAEGAYGDFYRSVGICHRRLIGFALETVQQRVGVKSRQIDTLGETSARDAYGTHMDSLHAGTYGKPQIAASTDDAARVAAMLKEQTEAEQAAQRYICHIAQRLIEERDAPARYGFDENQRPSRDVGVSFLELISRGPAVAKGVEGFARLCEARNYVDVEIAAGLLCLDEAMELAVSDLAHAYRLLRQAEKLQDEVKLGRSPLLSKMKTLQDAQQRIKDGARKGGEKTGATRKLRPPVIEATDEKLLAEELRLLASGKEQKDIAGILANRFGGKPDSVRKRLRTAKQKAALKGQKSRD
jgi:hypothetical protein